ncbi:MAG: hypothetical protein WBR26_13870, partial [Candidatus Acidiferrum sp.]
MRVFSQTVLTFVCLTLGFTVSGISHSYAQEPPAHAQQATVGTPAVDGQNAQQPGAPGWITKYTLPPDRDKLARALAKVTLRERLVDLVYGLIVLLVVLWWRVAPKYRNIAEKVSARRFLQVLVFAPLIALTIDVLMLPTEVYGHWISRGYGLSVQGWASWLWDWLKGGLLSVIFAIVVVWILYSVIHNSPRRWWFYFWLATLPLMLIVIFLAPLVIDPMFHSFEPLQVK